MENPLDPVAVGDRLATRPALKVPSPFCAVSNCSRAFYSSFSMPRSMISAKLTGRPSFSVALSESERIFS